MPANNLFSDGGLEDTILEIGGRVWTVRAVPDADALLANVQTDADLAAFPYGLLLWPSAVALAQWLTDRPEVVQGRRVLELGCGPGLPGMVARQQGGVVTQTDYQDAPLELARENALRNGISGIDSLIGDWRGFPELPPFPLVIGSDILYERALHPALRALLPRLILPGGTLLLADPLRPQSAVFVDALAQDGWDVGMDTQEIAWRGETREIALFTARRYDTPHTEGTR